MLCELTLSQTRSACRRSGRSRGAPAGLCRRPSPLGAELRFEAWQDRTEGRKIHGAGRLLCGDDVTAEADAGAKQDGYENQTLQVLEQRNDAEAGRRN